MSSNISEAERRLEQQADDVRRLAHELQDGAEKYKCTGQKQLSIAIIIGMLLSAATVIGGASASLKGQKLNYLLDKSKGDDPC